MSYKILVLEGITDRGLEILQAEGWTVDSAEGAAARRAGRRSSRRYDAMLDPQRQPDHRRGARRGQEPARHRPSRASASTTSTWTRPRAAASSS